MLNFRTAGISFIIPLTGVVVLHYSVGISWWWVLPVVLFYTIRLIIGSSKINSNFYTTVHCEGNTKEKEIAITFDDGPTSFTKNILQTLKEYNAPATFFVIGKNIAGHEDILKQTILAGHTIGNHTFSHSFFIDFKSTNGFKKELEQTSDAVYNTVGKRMKFFRPPYGVTTPHLAKAARELGYRIIGWNIRSLDTTKDSEEIIFNRITGQLKPGAILLFHDTSDKTNDVLKRTLQFVKKDGYTIVSLEKLLNKEAYS